MSMALTGCQSPEPAEQEPVLPPNADVRPVTRAAEAPPPISGGTLMVTSDGTLAVAADPDRDLVHVVDLESLRQLHAIALPDGDEPGRVVADDEGRVHVVARRGGVVIDIDPRAGRVLDRRAVCANPRGIAFQAERGALHVACAGGDLVTLPVDGGGATRRVWLGPDLRDVMVLDEQLAVTRFRSARLLRLDSDGGVVETETPLGLHRSEFFDGELHELQPNSAWRTIATPDGEWLMAHQVSSSKAIGPSRDHDSSGATDGFGDGGDGGGGYGGGPGRLPCAAVVESVVSLGDGDFDVRNSGLINETVLAVDVATSVTGSWIALAVAGKHEDGAEPRGVIMLPKTDLTDDAHVDCREPRQAPVPPGQYVSVAFDPWGNIIAQSREPAFLIRVDPFSGLQDEIPLQGDSVADTGHDLFHRDAGQLIACASCHPEGGDDGRVWRFAELGVRHTPSLAVGLAGTEPFHWAGDLEDMGALVAEVHVGRMGGRPLSPERVEALQSWMFSIPPMRARRSSSDAAALRGAESFAAWGCGDCHRGEALDGGPDNTDIGLELTLQVPALRGVAQHPPYMHDGRSQDLREAVLDMVTRTRPQLGIPSEAELADMVAYLETL